MEFGEWLRQEIKARGLSITEFAERVGVSQAAASRWLGGQRRPDKASIQRIALVLGEPTDVLMHMAGYEDVRGGQRERLHQQLMSLRAERQALQLQNQTLEQSLTEVDERIGELEEEAERLERQRRLDAPVLAIGLSIGRHRTVPETIEELKQPLEVLLAMNAGYWESRLDEVWHEFQYQWTDQARRAFMTGLELGLQAGILRAEQEKRDTSTPSTDLPSDEADATHRQ